MIEFEKAWPVFLAQAKIYEAENRLFHSPKDNEPYHIVSIVNDVVRIGRLGAKAESNSTETIGDDRFRTCIERFNRLFPSVPKNSLYKGVIVETTFVELLPELSWDEYHDFIVYQSVFESTNKNHGDFSQNQSNEAENDDLNDTVLRELRVRRGQEKLRQKLLEVYENRCVVTGCSIPSILHACHIIPHSEFGNNHSTNGFLMRGDIHDLFDAFLIGIDPETHLIEVREDLLNTEYGDLHGKKIRERNDQEVPDYVALKQRWERFVSRDII